MGWWLAFTPVASLQWVRIQQPPPGIVESKNVRCFNSDTRTNINACPYTCILFTLVGGPLLYLEYWSNFQAGQALVHVLICFYVLLFFQIYNLQKLVFSYMKWSRFGVMGCPGPTLGSWMALLFPLDSQLLRSLFLNFRRLT